jgi:hypothetical protein
MGQKPKIGMSLQLNQKPTLITCNETHDTEPGCSRCYKMHPEGFFCSLGRTKNKKRTINHRPKRRKTFEDHTSF